MQVERNELLDLLRSRHNEKTARRAVETLPPSIDLTRDRALLLRCGIDPNVLAAILTRGVPSSRLAALVVSSSELDVRKVDGPQSRAEAPADVASGGLTAVSGSSRPTHH